MLWSPVFEAMFQHDFKEKGSAQIELPGKSFDGMMELMRVLHPPNSDICGRCVRACVRACVCACACF